MQRLSLLALALYGALSLFAMFDSSIGIVPKTLIAAAFFAVAAILLGVLSRSDPQSASKSSID